MAIKTTDYVKFIRGNQAAFNALNQKDSNTLYFISEDGASTGSLYLGSKLISGGASESQLGSIVIENLGDKQILYFDYASNSWKNGSIYDAIGRMGGASENNDGHSGLVPAPKAGQQNLFLRGDGSWAEASTDFNENVFSKVSGKVSLLNFEQANPNSILIKGSAGKLDWTTKEDFLSEVKGSIQTLQEMMSTFNGGVRRTIVESLDKIDVNAENAENFIYMVSKAEEDRKDSNFYDEYMVVNGSIEKIGAGLSGNLTEDYVTSAAFNTQVGKIYSEMSKYTPLTTYESQIGKLSVVQSAMSGWGKDTIVEQVDFLTDLLTWYQLED